MGTSGYTAPEVFSPGRYSLPADVFSAAVLAWELFSNSTSRSEPNRKVRSEGDAKDGRSKEDAV